MSFTHKGWHAVPNNAMMWPVAFTSKSLASTDTYYSSTEREALGKLHGLEMFHHNCFAHKVSVLQAYHTGYKEYYYKSRNIT